jgi:hypothetical protein
MPTRNCPKCGGEMKLYNREWACHKCGERYEKKSMAIISILCILCIIFLASCDELIQNNDSQLQNVNVNQEDDSNLSSNATHILASKAICHWIIEPTGYLPDPDCSPGDVFNATLEEICVSGYSASVRSVSEKTKEQVYTNYGILTRLPGEYEMDHIISLSIGGSNDMKNLFPEPAEPKPGFHEKDKLEWKIQDLVCAGKYDLKEAQRKIASNWSSLYIEVFGEAP